MVQTDYRGARAANAGDDFQELWALRQALALLDQDAGLTAVAVEGLKAEDENGTPRDTWDGVDCSLYYGGNQAASAALQEMEIRLPSGSFVIVFDCYGSGRYLDSDAYRHRPRDAFLQLSNDLARQLRIPPLVNRSTDLDDPKVFKKRLERAAEVVASLAEDALLYRCS